MLAVCSQLSVETVSPSSRPVWTALLTVWRLTNDPLLHDHKFSMLFSRNQNGYAKMKLTTCKLHCAGGIIKESALLTFRVENPEVHFWTAQRHNIDILPQYGYLEEATTYRHGHYNDVCFLNGGLLVYTRIPITFLWSKRRGACMWASGQKLKIRNSREPKNVKTMIR